MVLQMDTCNAFNSASWTTIFQDGLLPIPISFSICFMILCMPIPTIFIACFLTQKFHMHFVQVLYTTWGSFGWNVVHLSTYLRFSPYYSSPPYLCFSFIHRWYAYCWSCIRCGTCFFVITCEVLALKLFY
jgi:hypothetical protein